LIIIKEKNDVSTFNLLIKLAIGLTYPYIVKSEKIVFEEAYYYPWASKGSVSKHIILFPGMS
jgi:hypothetical protein